MPQNFRPTDEQLAALDMAKKGDSFKVVAYAGAGKTSTLKLISEHKSGRGLYLAFNKAIATEAAQKFPHHVRCQTFHALAFRHVARNITAKLSHPKRSPAVLAKELGLTPIEVVKSLPTPRTTVLTLARLGMILGDSLSHFCKTHAAEPAPRHLVLPNWVDEPTAAYLQERLYPAFYTYWQQAIDPRHSAGIGHEVYLKLWTLSKPIVPADFVLFDEAQDADPLMMGALMKQSCQTIYVGDAHQQIYEWRGAINAMKRLPYEQSLLTQSFRFGNEIAKVANVFLTALQETIPLVGNPAKSSTLSTPKDFDAILCRTNASAMLLLMAGLKKGHKVALQADANRIVKFCQASEQLKQGKHAYGVPELSYFQHWNEVVEFAESGDGSEIKTWVRLVEDYGSKTIEKAIHSLSPPAHADYIVSTAHKSKGLEWERVRLYDDFLYDISALSVKISTEELRLLYVACTRAKSVLDLGSLNELIESLLNKKVIFV